VTIRTPLENAQEVGIPRQIDGKTVMAIDKFSNPS